MLTGAISADRLDESLIFEVKDDDEGRVCSAGSRLNHCARRLSLKRSMSLSVTSHKFAHVIELPDMMYASTVPDGQSLK